jgi:hypothetical protein
VTLKEVAINGCAAMSRARTDGWTEKEINLVSKFPLFLNNTWTSKETAISFFTMLNNL